MSQFPPGQPRTVTGRNEGLLTAITQASLDAIIGITPDGFICDWNPAAERIYGYRATQIAGRPAARLCPAGRAAEWADLRRRAASGEQVPASRVLQCRQDGSEFPAQVAAAPVPGGDGEQAGVALVVRDLSAQERTGAELARLAGDLQLANHNLETFTITVSHDLVSPVRAMSGFADALLEDLAGSLGEEGRDYAERIRAASGRLTTLINDLLQLSLLSRSPLRPQPVDLGAEASDIASDLRRGDPGRQVRFAIQQPAWANADRHLIRTVLRNLLDNAWKFTSREDRAVIEFGSQPSGSTVRYYVRDNGVGFDQATAGKLFTPFWRLPTASDFPGTGVGLAGVKQIVERHGGRVWPEAAAGKGATFFFTLGEE